MVGFGAMLLVLSSLFGAVGGIPAFNKLLCRAAAEYAGRALRVVVLTDDPQQPAVFAAAEQLRALLPGVSSAGWYVPCGGDRRRCLLEILRGLPAARPLLFGHVNLAPLGLIAPRRYGVIAHGTEVWTPLRWDRRLAVRAARVVAGVSEHTRSSLIHVQGVAARRCMRVINAIEVLPSIAKSAHLETAENASSRPLRVLSITRLYPGEPKGIELVLRAIAAVPSMSYTIIGEGADRPRLQALADELRLGDRVRFTGAVSDLERDRALAACDLFALPSSGEGFGIVYLEAMAHGKPCLAARVGGAPEVVLDGETGVLAFPTVDSVRAALVRLEDAKLRARLGAAGRARVAEHFSYLEYRRQISAFFDRLVSD